MKSDVSLCVIAKQVFHSSRRLETLSEVRDTNKRHVNQML
jgi:hypothetical protein